MKRSTLFLIPLLVLTASGAGLEKRVKWTSSHLTGTPDPPPPYRLVRAFPQIQFKEPVFLVGKANACRVTSVGLRQQR